MITYLKGDATAPVDPNRSGFRVIAHIANSSGGWGRGFVVALSKRWPQPEASYRAWAKEARLRGSEQELFALGHIQIVKVEPTLWVANMIAQEGYGADGRPPVRYDALETCLTRLAQDVSYMVEPTIHMPRIGCSLGGGRWSEVEPIINKCLESIPVYVYDFPGGVFNP
jgi:O-acetyl-ADP-ribose deacetylase (regulator of RNase III)